MATEVNKDAVGYKSSDWFKPGMHVKSVARDKVHAHLNEDRHVIADDDDANLMFTRQNLVIFTEIAAPKETPAAVPAK